METYELAEQDYIKGLKYKEIAEKYGVSLNTVKSWKTRYDWVRGAKKGNSKNSKKECAHKKEESMHTNSEQENEDEELSEEDRFFCVYYLKSFNAVKSYMKVHKCTYEAAAVSAHRKLKNPKIKKYLDSLMEERMEQIQIREEDVLQKYVDIALADMNDFMVSNGMGGFLPAKEIDGTIVQEIKQGQFGVSIKLNDRMKALDKLEKYFERKAQIELAKQKKEEEDSYIGEIHLMDRLPEPEEENEGSIVESAAEAGTVSGEMGK